MTAKTTRTQTAATKPPVDPLEFKLQVERLSHRAGVETFIGDLRAMRQEIDLLMGLAITATETGGGLDPDLSQLRAKVARVETSATAVTVTGRLWSVLSDLQQRIICGK